MNNTLRIPVVDAILMLYRSCGAKLQQDIGKNVMSKPDSEDFALTDQHLKTADFQPTVSGATAVESASANRQPAIANCYTILRLIQQDGFVSPSEPIILGTSVDASESDKQQMMQLVREANWESIGELVPLKVAQGQHRCGVVFVLFCMHLSM